MSRLRNTGGGEGAALSSCPDDTDTAADDTADIPAGDDGDIPIFDDDGALSRAFLLHRGYCCGNGCRNCPYGFRAAPEPGGTIR